MSYNYKKLNSEVVLSFDVDFDCQFFYKKINLENTDSVRCHGKRALIQLHFIKNPFKI